MKIEVLKIKDLIPFVESDLYKSFDELPITKLRAISQANNPRASADDPALLIALNDKNEVTSYLGFLPDTITIGEISQRIFSNSCWWAKKDCNDNGAMQLFFLGCKLTNNQIFFPDLTPHTSQLMSKMRNFSVCEFNEGICGYLKFDLANVVVRKLPIIGQFKPLVSVLDSLLNLAYKPIIWNWKNKTSRSKLQAISVESIDNELSEFIRSKQENELFQRNQLDLNWILANSWLTTDKTQKNANYAFTHIVKSHKTIAIKVLNGSKICSFFMIGITNNKADLLYFYDDNNQVKALVSLIYSILIKHEVHSFISFHQEINHQIKQNKNPFIHVRKRVKKLAIATEFEQYLHPNRIQHGDGDNAFVV